MAGSRIPTRKIKIFESLETIPSIMGFVWAEFFAFARQAVETLKYLRSLNAELLGHIEQHGFTTEPPSR
jgi:hypothetical protein